MRSLVVVFASVAWGFGPTPFVVRRSPSLAAVPAEVLVDALPSGLMSFADQGSNLAGKFFQFSLAPYLGFLYFLNYGKVGAPPLVRFGFGYLLFFVLATIPTGLISKGTWGVSLADCDWLHGGAESLLTVTNVLIVLGFRRALRNEVDARPFAELVAVVCLAGVAALVATGVPVLHLGAHDPFLGGLGNLPVDEPANALSIPTWAVHFSSVAEFVVAIALANDFARATGNPKWRGFALAMLPSHASGICACVYHVFYNQPDMAWLVTTQAGLTFLGNCTLCLAAFRLALAAGWSLETAFDLQSGRDVAITADDAFRPAESDPFLLAEVAAFALVSAYATKYASIAILPFLQSPHDLLAAGLVLASPVAVAAAVLREDDDDQAPAF